MSDPIDLATVRAVLERHRDDLLQRYRANGVGIGKDGSDYTIVVYVSTRDNAPIKLEGVPVKFEVAGPFTALKS